MILPDFNKKTKFYAFLTQTKTVLTISVVDLFTIDKSRKTPALAEKLILCSQLIS